MIIRCGVVVRRLYTLLTIALLGTQRLRENRPPLPNRGMVSIPAGYHEEGFTGDRYGARQPAGEALTPPGSRVAAGPTMSANVAPV
jgi:hypothetical protein